VIHEEAVGTVALLTRFPVKSTAGENLSSVALDGRGVRHDRVWAVYTADGGIASGKDSQRFRKVDGLLAWRSRVDAASDVWLSDPDGVEYSVSDPAASAALSSGLGQPLVLRREADALHFDDCGVHLVTMSSIRAISRDVGRDIDPRRTRANIVLDTGGAGFAEDDWSGWSLAIGPDVVLELGEGMPRCVMVDRAQAGVAADPPILKTLGRTHDVLLGLQANVLKPGQISVGDDARLIRAG
jgi:uncharacterized protein YcbX